MPQGSFVEIPIEEQTEMWNQPKLPPECTNFAWTT